MFLSFYIFIFGLVVGSFLNCVIYRMALQKKMPPGPGRKAVSFLRGKSFCPQCKHQLNWYDLIPILSYILLVGRCRYCKKMISLQYPFVELATGLLFLALFNPDHIIRTCFLFIVSCFLIVIFVYDIKHYIIPDVIVFPLIGLTLVYNLFLLLTGDYSLSVFLNTIYAGFFSALFFFLIFIVSRGKWIGFGDVKLALFMGIFLGFPNIVVALYLAFFIGGIIGIGLIIVKIKNIKSEIPFGPFLITGTYLTLFFGESLLNWYLNLL